MRDDARAAAARGFYGMIAAARIDDERVGAERRRQQALRDVGRGIARNHHQRNGKRPGHAHSKRRVRVRRSAASMILVFNELPRFYVVCQSFPGACATARTGLMRIARRRDERCARRPPFVARRYRLRALRSLPTSAANGPSLPIDWVAEPGFVPLIALVSRRAPCDSVRTAQLAARAARGGHLARACERFGQRYARTRYAAILDLQEQVKGALIARMARGRATASTARAFASRSQRSATTFIIAFRAICTS